MKLELKLNNNSSSSSSNNNRVCQGGEGLCPPTNVQRNVFLLQKTDFRTDCQANEVVMVQKMFSFSGLCPWPGTLRHVGRSAARLPCVVGSRGSLWLSIISPWSEDHKRRECTHVQRRQTRVSFRPNCKPENLVLLSKARQSICVTEYSTLTKQLDGDSTVEPPTSLQSPYSVLATSLTSAPHEEGWLVPLSRTQNLSERSILMATYQQHICMTSTTLGFWWRNTTNSSLEAQQRFTSKLGGHPHTETNHPHTGAVRPHTAGSSSKWVYLKMR